ncbi:AEC family transporter [Pseudodonghicola flavimaris]|uniref:AEC family transporter n=1 Tax=Pseudodonghicola flavimaris TaxID=3050036 RepID=A0ABT7F5P6_9RHOB|nr:AEC family transporter [Pseudodonghicola flavimaris]MDK3019931.1 AEC family transporter [Pseudodonghicola flavimaris]
MIDIFLRTLPFFAIIGLGYWAGRTRFISQDATAYLTKFVFFFPLSALIFRVVINLSLPEVLDLRLMLGYLCGTGAIYLLATAVALLRRQDIPTTAIEAQCAVIGNTGFLGLPMLTMMFGPQAVAPLMLVLVVDLLVFSSLVVMLINGARDGRIKLSTFRMMGMGLLRNPMIVSLVAALIWSAAALPVPVPVNDFLSILGGAATPGALFAIGASLAGKSAERVQIAGWLSFCKLVLHPAAVALALLVIFPVDPFAATVVITIAALPVASNVYMIAQHYGTAPHRASAAILISTMVSILSLPAVIALLTG